VLAAAFAISVVGRSRKQKRVIGRDFRHRLLQRTRQTYHYRQYEQAFVQPNAPVNEHMLNWATATQRDAGDLLELYCGNGNFTLPMAASSQGDRHRAVQRAAHARRRDNMQANGVDNAQVIRLSAEEVSEALAGTREFVASRPAAAADGL
jgi:tRNA (uracil-5-)-methyltransferase